MYSMLIVDDERFAVQGISQGIDWTELGIGNIFEAYDYVQACRILETEDVDILLADVEMPGKSGLDLLKWMNEQHYSPITIFLTGHANFKYAQQALELGGFKYILKPVDHEQLMEMVGQAIEKYNADREMRNYNQLYQKYFKLWEAQLPVQVERFWQDIFLRKLNPASAHARHLLQQCGLPLNAGSKIVTVLISIEEWYKEFTVKDEGIMEFALRSAAKDIFLPQMDGNVIQVREGTLAVLIYIGDEVGGSALENILEQCVARCREYIRACNEYFYCAVSCYVGEPSTFDNILTTHTILTEMERKNTKNRNVIFLQKEYVHEDSKIPPIPWIPDWFYLLDMGKKEDLLQHVDQLCSELNKDVRTTSETLEAVYYGLNYMIRYVLQKKGLDVNKVYGEDDVLHRKQAFTSVANLHIWSKKAISRVIDFINLYSKDTSSVVDKVHTYVSEHLSEELSRDEIASNVYLNPVYLSRLFRQTTGQTLTDYIIQIRMEQAQALLKETNLKVSRVAENVGYSHYSHFSKVFKNAVGVTPQQFRKKYHVTLD